MPKPPSDYCDSMSEYGIDPARLGVLGASAGGWLAKMMGTISGDKSFDKGDFPDQSSDV